MIKYYFRPFLFSSLFIEEVGRDRPVLVKPKGAPTGQSGTAVGIFAAMASRGQASWPDDRLLFDMTDAARRYGGQELAVELVPRRLSPAGSRA